MNLGICSRSGDILEPMITPQWYVNCDGMAKRALDAVEKGDLKIVPAEHKKTWDQWLGNIRDWCVSRQLWWGHQIPAWFAVKKGEVLDKNDIANNDRWIVARTEEVCPKSAWSFAAVYVYLNLEFFPVLRRLLMKRQRICSDVQKMTWSSLETKMFLILGLVQGSFLFL